MITLLFLVRLAPITTLGMMKKKKKSGMKDFVKILGERCKRRTLKKKTSPNNVVI
jgi:hypothetical protein